MYVSIYIYSSTRGAWSIFKGVGVTKSCDMPHRERTTKGEPKNVLDNKTLPRHLSDYFWKTSRKVGVSMPKSSFLVCPQSHPFQAEIHFWLHWILLIPKPLPKLPANKTIPTHTLDGSEIHSQPPFGCRKPYKIMGYLPYQLLQDFWTINGTSQPVSIFNQGRAHHGSSLATPRRRWSFKRYQKGDPNEEEQRLFSQGQA